MSIVPGTVPFWYDEDNVRTVPVQASQVLVLQSTIRRTVPYRSVLHCISDS